MIARLICWYKGHRRGVRVHPSMTVNPVAVNSPEATFQCPRCKAAWTRKVKK